MSVELATTPLGVPCLKNTTIRAGRWCSSHARSVAYLLELNSRDMQSACHAFPLAFFSTRRRGEHYSDRSSKRTRSTAKVSRLSFSSTDHPIPAPCAWTRQGRQATARVAALHLAASASIPARAWWGLGRLDFLTCESHCAGGGVEVVHCCRAGWCWAGQESLRYTARNSRPHCA